MKELLIPMKIEAQDFASKRCKADIKWGKKEDDPLFPGASRRNKPLWRFSESSVYVVAVAILRFSI